MQILTFSKSQNLARNYTLHTAEATAIRRTAVRETGVRKPSNHRNIREQNETPEASQHYRSEGFKGTLTKAPNMPRDSCTSLAVPCCSKRIERENNSKFFLKYKLYNFFFIVYISSFIIIIWNLCRKMFSSQNLCSIKNFKKVGKLFCIHIMSEHCIY